jgi:REP element-mobilizing transposase RayT
MSTYTQILYHIVFSTKNRKNTLNYENHNRLFQYIWGIIKNKKSHLYRIDGVKDHIHIATSIHSTITLADFIKDIKIASSNFIKSENLFPKFDNWQIGYGAFTVSYSSKDTLIEYIKNQKEHHRKVSFKDELKKLLKENGVKFDEKYLL